MVGTAWTACAPSRMIDPLPNCFSICPKVAPRACLRSFSSMGASFASRGDLHYKTLLLSFVAVVIGGLIAVKRMCVGCRILRKHRRVPRFVVLYQPSINFGLPALKVRPLERIVNDVEQKGVFGDL